MNKTPLTSNVSHAYAVINLSNVHYSGNDNGFTEQSGYRDCPLCGLIIGLFCCTNIVLFYQLLLFKGVCSEDPAQGSNMYRKSSRVGKVQGS